MMNVTVPAGAQLASTSKPKAVGREQHEIRIPVPSYGNTRQLKADRSLIEGPGEVYTEIVAPLLKASLKCDWEAAEAILDKNPDLVRYSLTENGETALHVAASVKGRENGEMFVENLMNRMESADLEIVNDDSNTALCLAAAFGNIKTVEVMLKKTPSGGQMMPLCMAILFGNYEAVRYLYERSNNLCDDGWNFENRGWLLEKCVEANMFDVALKIVKVYPQLGNGNVLENLARKPDVFRKRQPHIIGRFINLIEEAYGNETTEAMQLLQIIWEDIRKKPREDIYAILKGSLNADEQRSFQVLFIAAEMGNAEFLVELIRHYPDLILKKNDKNHTIFHIAVKRRHESIFNLLYEIDAMKDLIVTHKDDDGNNMLHLVAKIAEHERLENLSGAVSHMQREVLWFKEVQSMIPPMYIEQKNNDGLTPNELFKKEHRTLVKEDERWMKETINYCVVVAALIATIAFAAAITIPGGYNQNNGIPIFYRKQTFVVFVTANAISLVLSSTSILIFLSIITSRFPTHDFLELLPSKLWFGISNLFLSVAAMLIAFCASFFILYPNEMQWIPTFVSVFSSMPVIVHAVRQYEILSDIFRTTYSSSSRYMFKRRKQFLY